MRHITLLTILLSPILMWAQDDVVMKPDVLAQYDGGDAKMYKEIDEILVIPEEISGMGLTHRQAFSFIVELDGTISDIHSEYCSPCGPCMDCPESAKKALLSLEGKWIPAQHEGKAVRSKKMIRILFKS